MAAKASRRAWTSLSGFCFYRWDFAFRFVEFLLFNYRLSTVAAVPSRENNLPVRTKKVPTTVRTLKTVELCPPLRGIQEKGDRAKNPCKERNDTKNVRPPILFWNAGKWKPNSEHAANVNGEK